MKYFIPLSLALVALNFLGTSSVQVNCSEMRKAFDEAIPNNDNVDDDYRNFEKNAWLEPEEEANYQELLEQSVVELLETKDTSKTPEDVLELLKTIHRIVDILPHLRLEMVNMDSLNHLIDLGELELSECYRGTFDWYDDVVEHQLKKTPETNINVLRFVQYYSKKLGEKCPSIEEDTE